MCPYLPPLHPLLVYPFLPPLHPLLVYPYLPPLHPLRTHQTNSEILCLSQAAVIITVIQVLSTIHAHKNTVMDCQWNKNGNWLLTASRDHLLKLFDIRYDEGHFALGLYSEIFKP